MYVELESQEEIDTLLEFGRKHGFGRAIQLLRTEWAKELNVKYEIPTDETFKITSV